MIGGLARTFANPLVYKSIKGHVIDPLGTDPTAVFAHIRLEDKRGMTAYGKKDLSGTIHTERSDVEKALEYLGADPLDVRLVESAMPPVPDCEGWRKPEVLPPGKTCQSYADPCSFHALLGQLWSRKELYSMAKAHEARRGLHFDLFLYMRPDLTATIPLLPWCYYPLNIARHLHDWIWFVPRAAASALFESVPDDYYKCRSEYTRKLFHDAWNHVTDFKERDGDKRPQSDAIGGFKGIHMTGFDIENWMKVRAAAHGVQLYLDDSLGTLALTRTNDPRFPHKFDCRYLAIALRAIAPPEQEDLSVAEKAAGHGAYYTHYKLAAQLVQQSVSGGRSLTACASITYANPSNRPESSS